MHVTELNIMEQIYTFVDDNGTNVHIASGKLLQWCLANNPEVFNTPVEDGIAAGFIRDNSVDLARALALTRKQLETPITYCKSGTFTNGGPDVMLADGHHRYLRAALDGKKEIAAWVLEKEQWEPFKIDGLFDLTQEQLRNEPVIRPVYECK